MALKRINQKMITPEFLHLLIKWECVADLYIIALRNLKSTRSTSNGNVKLRAEKYCSLKQISVLQFVLSSEVKNSHLNSVRSCRVHGVLCMESELQLTSLSHTQAWTVIHETCFAALCKVIVIAACEKLHHSSTDKHMHSNTDYTHYMLLVF